MAVTKADLAETLFNELGLNKREAKEFVELFFEKLRESLESGTSVKLSGFGNFGVRDKSSRPGRNPKTGEEIPISARRVVTFKASQKLKDRVADNADNLSVDGPAKQAGKATGDAQADSGSATAASAEPKPGGG